VGVCPGEEESAGINYSHRSPKGNRQMKGLLNQASNAAVKTKGSIFEFIYRRLVFGSAMLRPLELSRTVFVD
jgi:transposase